MKNIRKSATNIVFDFLLWLNIVHAENVREEAFNEKAKKARRPLYRRAVPAVQSIVDALCGDDIFIASKVKPVAWPESDRVDWILSLLGDPRFGAATQLAILIRVARSKRVPMLTVKEDTRLCHKAELPMSMTIVMTAEEVLVEEEKIFTARKLRLNEAVEAEKAEKAKRSKIVAAQVEVINAVCAMV